MGRQPTTKRLYCRAVRILSLVPHSYKPLDFSDQNINVLCAFAAISSQTFGNINKQVCRSTFCALNIQLLLARSIECAMPVSKPRNIKIYLRKSCCEDVSWLRLWSSDELLWMLLWSFGLYNSREFLGRWMIINCSRKAEQILGSVALWGNSIPACVTARTCRLIATAERLESDPWHEFNSCHLCTTSGKILSLAYHNLETKYENKRPGSISWCFDNAKSLFDT